MTSSEQHILTFEQDGEVHYVLQETEGGEMGVDESGTEIVCPNGSRAFLLNGQYYVADSGQSQAIFYQEGDESDQVTNQYYINDNPAVFQFEELSSSSASSELYGTHYLIERNESGSGSCYNSHQQQQQQTMIYYATEQGAELNTDGVDETVERVQDEDGNIYPMKRIKLEAQQLLDFDEFRAGEEGEAGRQILLQDTSPTQYAISAEVAPDIENHAWIEQGQGQNETTVNQTTEGGIDLSKITGRNLLTGQTVTLRKYMDKLKRNRSESGGSRKAGEEEGRGARVGGARTFLGDLIDRKIAIGQTRSGKKIVGKIIHVEKRGGCDGTMFESDEEDEEEHEVEDGSGSDGTGVVLGEEGPEHSRSADDDNKLIISENDASSREKVLDKRSIPTKETLEEISKTLCGVMEMYSVKNRLENKNILVKLIEKRQGEGDICVKSTSFCYGYMEREGEAGTRAEGSRATTNNNAWRFVPDTEEASLDFDDSSTSDSVVFNQSKAHNEGDVTETGKMNKIAKYPSSVNLTISISRPRSGPKTIRVNLNPPSTNMCKICTTNFSSSKLLRQHLCEVHNQTAPFGCDVCPETFADVTTFDEHKQQHVAEGKLFSCRNCDQLFRSEVNLLNHRRESHETSLTSLECDICWERCESEWALKKHLFTHTGYKPYPCDVCHKEFLTRHDVTHHRKVHFPERHFACEVCFRTFSRHSNLLRHMEIHKGANRYQCEICNCSYNYISSLTRHMVQNHIDVNDYREKS